VLHKVEQRCNLILDLRGRAEDVGIVLHEPPHTRQASQRSACLIPVDDTELGHADGELLVTAIFRVEDEAVARAVHGFKGPLLLLDVEREHVVLVVLPVTRGLPELRVVHVGRDDLLVATLEVLLAHELDKGIVDPRSVREEEAASGAQVVEEEEFLVFADLPVVPLRCLSEECLILGQLLLVREGDTVDSLEGVVGVVTEEVGCGVFGDHECLDFSGVGDMRADAEINHGATAVDSRGGAVGDLGFDEVLLVLVVVEHFEELLLGHDETLELLLVLDGTLGKLLEGGVVGVGDGAVGGHFVEEAFVSGGTEAEVAAVVTFR